MNRRGRPPHPDVLTPRQWQVLALLREGLSNEQIALRLGISLDGVKFHVSEILGKLGVGSRNEAAQWEGEQRQPAPSACLARMRGAGSRPQRPLSPVARAFSPRTVRSNCRQPPRETVLHSHTTLFSSSSAATGVLRDTKYQIRTTN